MSYWHDACQNTRGLPQIEKTPSHAADGMKSNSDRNDFRIPRFLDQAPLFMLRSDAEPNARGRAEPRRQTT